MDYRLPEIDVSSRLELALVHVGVSLIAVPQLVRQHAAPTADGLTAILLLPGCTRNNHRATRAVTETSDWQYLFLPCNTICSLKFPLWKSAVT